MTLFRTISMMNPGSMGNKKLFGSGSISGSYSDNKVMCGCGGNDNNNDNNDMNMGSSGNTSNCCGSSGGSYTFNGHIQFQGSGTY